MIVQSASMMSLSVVLAQFPVGFSIQNNLEMIDSVLRQTHPYDLVIFPEGCVSGYSTDVTFIEQVNLDEVMAGLHEVRQTAEKRGISVWVGACVQQAGKWFNAAYGFSPDGKVQIYHKINLANHERGTFTPGSELPVFDLITAGGVVPLGVQICRELRFPEQWGWLARHGAQLFVHLNNAIGEDAFQQVWKSHLVSRAAETQRFVLSANNAAPKQNSPTLAVNPQGFVLGEIVSEAAAILRLDIDLSRVSNGYLEQCREDVVRITSAQ